ncbi:MAG: PIN domain-containing protein [Thermoanaerobaculaceae bacterium]
MVACRCERSSTGDTPEAFLDTNILVYALADDDAARHAVAAELVSRGFETGRFAVSTQVMLELFVTVTRKLATPLSHADASAFLDALAAWPVVSMTPGIVQAAVAQAARHRLSVWDATILEAARSAGCAVVYSEDLGDGASYDGIVVRNPFTRPIEQPVPRHHTEKPPRRP